MAPYISVSGLEALAWVLVAVNVVLTAGRYVLRSRRFGQRNKYVLHRFGVEDYLHLLGLLVAITYVALQTSGLALFIAIENWNIAHKADPAHPIDLADEDRFFNIRFGAVLIFWIGMYSIKFSFLTLYRTLFWPLAEFRRWWWVVSIFTFFSFWISFFACLWVCGWPVNPLNLKQCLQKHSTIQNNIEYLWCGLSVSTSLAIMIMPIFTVHTLHMKKSRKLQLSAIFFLASLDIVFDCLRTFYTTNAVGISNLWQILEINIAVMLSALVSYGTVIDNIFRGGAGSVRKLLSILTGTRSSDEQPPLSRAHSMAEKDSASCIVDGDPSDSVSENINRGNLELRA